MKNWFLAALGLMLTWMVSAQEMRIMTFNIRFDYLPDTANAWSRRSAHVAQTIALDQPDVVGMQEVLHYQLADILENLPGYQSYGFGRDDGHQAGEYSPILYRVDRFTDIRSGQFWLSEQPEVPGSMSWGTACTRIATWMVLFDREVGDSVLVVNTHFDHVSDLARGHGAMMIDSFIREQAIPNVWCMGDFNATLEDDALEPLYDHFSESRHTAASTIGPSFTFHGFNGSGEKGHIIDHIFYRTPDWRIQSYEVDTRFFKGHYPSDHFPVLAVFQQQ